MPITANDASTQTDPAIIGGASADSLKVSQPANISPAMLVAWLANTVGHANWFEALQLAMLANANSGLLGTGDSLSDPGVINGGGAPGGTQAPDAQTANVTQSASGSTSLSPGATQIESSPFVYTDINGGGSTAALAQSSDPLASPNQSADFSMWADLLDPSRPSAQTTLSSTDPLSGAFNPIAASSLAQSPMGAA